MNFAKLKEDFQDYTYSQRRALIAISLVAILFATFLFTNTRGRAVAQESAKPTLTMPAVAKTILIHVAGKELNTLADHKVPELRRQVGTVFQDFRLLPNKTVSENVAFTLHVLGYSNKQISREVPEVLELVGLEEKGDRRPNELSGGEQQRVAIARAYVSRPTILIADEPTGNLDPATSVGIMKLLDRINREGTTVVMATHDSGIVDQMRKRVIELEGGHVIRDQARGVYGYTG